jgi:hypothetical protein
MEQRRAPRFSIDQAVAVTVLGPREQRHAGKVKNASARGLALEMPAPVPPGTALKIEFDDSVVLGEAVYCRRDPESHLIGVELDQILCGLTELGRKLQEFATEPASGSEMTYALKNRNRENHD